MRDLVLVVDDEALIALDLSATVEQSGRKVLGPAFSLDQARSLIARQTPELAILDINVGNEVVWPLARELSGRGCAVIFISGDGRQRMEVPEFAGVPCLEKPTTPRDVIEALDSLVGLRD